MKKLLLGASLLLLAFASSALAATARPVVVFAGSASQPPLEEAVAAFTAKTGVPVTLHIGGSGAMLSQIRLTGLGDVYIPGSPDYLEKARSLHLVEQEEAILAYLVPAILVARGNPHKITTLADLARPGLRVGLADPDGVCVGLYAVEVLEANRLTERVRPNLRGMVESCAKAAAMIPLNLVDAVLGWREFAAWNPTALQAVDLRPEEIPRLAYVPAALLAGRRNDSGARALIAFLQSADGQVFFRNWGYATNEIDVRKFAPQARIGGLYHLPEAW